MRTLAKPVLVLCGVLAACNTSTTPVVTTWQAQLTATNLHDRLTGNVAVVSERDRFNAGIQVKNAPAEANLTWQLRTGTCDQPGDILGGLAVYPALMTDTLGLASAQAVVGASLRADGQYEASIMDAGAVTLACGELVRQ